MTLLKWSMTFYETCPRFLRLCLSRLLLLSWAQYIFTTRRYLIRCDVNYNPTIMKMINIKLLGYQYNSGLEASLAIVSPNRSSHSCIPLILEHVFTESFFSCLLGIWGLHSQTLRIWHARDSTLYVSRLRQLPLWDQGPPIKWFMSHYYTSIFTVLVHIVVPHCCHGERVSPSGTHLTGRDSHVVCSSRHYRDI